MLVWAKNNPEATVTFERNGTLYEEQNAASLKQDIDRILFPAWVNKWFHFQPVELASPEPCGV